MSHDIKSAHRPPPDQVLVDIAEYALSYRVESELAYDPCPMIREGMMVEVVHGPLKGVVGRLMRKSDKARLVLSVDLIGQAVSVDVDVADVRPY